MKPRILSLVIAVIATTIGAGWIINQFHAKIYSNTNEMDRSLYAYKQLGMAVGNTLDDFSQRDEFVEHWESNSSIEISFQNLNDFPVPSDIDLGFKNGVPLLLESDGEMSLHIYMVNSDEVMTMVLPIQNANNQQSRLNVVLTLLFYLVVIVVLLAWLYPLIKRLVMLQKAANRFGQGDLSSRLAPSKLSYISGIENEFNRMASHIQKLIDDNKLLSRAVSHNLKTPITRLRMGIDVLEEETDQAAIDGYIKRINTDLDEMQSLVETLLQYSSLDEFNLKLKNESIDLRQFVPKLFENANTTDINVSIFISDENVVVTTDPRYLSMQLNNIMYNALQHAKSVVEVRVELGNSNNQDSMVIITIEDDGNGISEAELVHVTKPFWRGENNPSIPGHGMGLAIVARIADWLKAELVIRRSQVLGGASISLLLKNSISN